MPSKNLARHAHLLAHEIICTGDFSVDATAGNGHDTVFLAEAVGRDGCVWAFDVQKSALETTLGRLEAKHLSSRVNLILAGHEHMDEHLPSVCHGAVAAIFFNLGYLPGAERAIATQVATTVRALDVALLRLLKPGGLLSVLVYPGHASGVAESLAVSTWLGTRRGMMEYEVFTGAAGELTPWLAAIRKNPVEMNVCAPR